MTCNCGNGDTPEYYITLDGVGVDGYSPEVNVVDDTSSSFKIEVVNKSNTQETPAIPKLSYLPTEYLKVDGSNASNPITLNNLQIRNNSGYVSIGKSDLTTLNLQARALNLVETDSNGDQQSIIQMQNDGDILVYAQGQLLLRGSADRPSYQKGTGTTYSLARVIDIPTKTSDLTNDSGYITSSDLPTVGNGTITLTQNGVTKGTFTTNQSGNTTIALDSGVTNPLILNAYGEAGTGTIGIEAGATGADNEIWVGQNTGGGTLFRQLILLSDVADNITLTDNSFGTKKLSINEMTGCDSITGGASGLVPAPSAGDENKFLKADGTWDTVGGGGSSYTAGTGIDITNDTISVKDVQRFTQITIANGYNTGEGLFGRLDDGSAIIPLVRVSDLDDVIIGDDGTKLVLHGNETRPSYFDSHTTSYLALYSDIPDTSDMATKTWVGNQGYLTSSSLSGYATETWVGQQGYALASNLSTVATSGSYADLLNRPTIPTNSDYVDLTSNQTVGGNKTFTGTNYLRNTYICNAGGTYFGRMRAVDNKFTFEGIGTNRSINFIPDGTGELQYNGNEVQTTNKLVTSVDSSSTDSQYPSAKLFYDTVGDIETLINAL